MTGPLGLGTAPSITDPAAATNFSVLADAFFASLSVFETNLASYGNGVSLGFYSASSTSMSVPSAGASVSMTVATGKGFAVGQRVIVASTIAPSANWFYATVTSYNSGTGALVLVVDFAIGAGTISSWSVTLSQPYVGAVGASGTSTTSFAVPAIGGSVTMTASALRTWQVGDTLQVVSTASPSTVRFVGSVTAYNNSTGVLTLTVLDALGSGTVANWSISPGSTNWGVNGTTTTSIAVPAIGGSVTMTASALRTWQVGDTLQVVSTASPSTVRFVGTVTAYSNSTGVLTLTCKWARGNGTLADWTITQAVNDTLLNMWTAIDSGSSVTLDLSAANHFIRTVGGATTFAFSNAPTGQAFGFSLRVTHTSGAITWPASVVWPEGYAPTLTIGKTHRFYFTTDNAGSTFSGAALPNYTA